MSKNQLKSKSAVGQSNSKRTAHSERAIHDGAFHCRPLWRVQRPDGEHGPLLTAFAQNALSREGHHADSHD